MACTGKKGTWTISYNFYGSPRPDATYANSNEDDSPSFSNESGQAILRSACDGRNMEPPYFAGSFSSVNITNKIFTPDDTVEEKYDCMNGVCVSSANGFYASLSACQTACGKQGCSGQCVSSSDWAQIEGLVNQLKNRSCS